LPEGQGYICAAAKPPHRWRFASQTAGVPPRTHTAVFTPENENLQSRGLCRFFVFILWKDKLRMVS